MSPPWFSRLLNKITSLWWSASTSQRQSNSTTGRENEYVTAKDLQAVFALQAVELSEPCCEKIVRIHLNLTTHKYVIHTVDYIIGNVLDTFKKFEDGGIIPEGKLGEALECNSPYKHDWSSGFLGRLIEAADPDQKKGINNEQFIVLREGIAAFISNQRWLPSNLPLPTQERIESFVVDLVSYEHAKTLPGGNEDVYITAEDLQEVFTQKNTPISLPCCAKIIKIHMNLISHDYKVTTVEYIIENCLGAFNKFERDGVILEGQLAQALEHNSPYKHNWSAGFLWRLIEAADPDQKKRNHC